MRDDVRFYIEKALRAHKDSEIKLHSEPMLSDGSSKIIHYYVTPEDTNVRDSQCIKISRNEAIEEAIEYITYLEDRVQKLEEESKASDIDYDLFIQVLKSSLTHDEYNRFIKKIMTINAKCRKYLNKGV